MARKTDEPGLAIDPRLLARLTGIELRSRFLVKGLYNNCHRTRDFGASSEFIEFREYRWGDDIRSIDWRTYARTDRFHVKLHEMESIMKLFLVLDVSDSMRVPAPEGLPSKLDLAAVIAGTIAMMAVKQQDSVGLVTVGRQVEREIPARQGLRHLALLYEHLSNPRGGGGGDFGEILTSIAERLGTRGVVFVISDALDDSGALFEGLKLLRVRGHDVSLIQVLDQAEVEFPFDRMTEFRHPEDARRLVGNPLAMRRQYLARFQAHMDELAAFCKSRQVDYLRLHNGEDLINLLALHFLKRLTVKAA